MGREGPALCTGGEQMASVLGVLVSTLMLAVFLGGLHRTWLSFEALRDRPVRALSPVDGPWPTVTIQLPLYNEPAVTRRLLDAIGAFDAPRDRVDIQILDDSTDRTRDAVEEGARALRAHGWRVSVRRRASRDGFKAGALAEGLTASTAEFVAIFDADFVPGPDFLARALGAFGPAVGMVQGRWTFLDAGRSWLASVQALLLSAHFSIEHEARFRGGRWFNFNGTAGVWRRRAIDEAGGWSGDTLTEDLDLSYRAQLAGWRFVYVDDLEVPSELPASLHDFLVQQRRWATGGVQCAAKLLPAIWRARAPWSIRLEASWHLLQNLSHPVLLALALLWPWVASGVLTLPSGPWNLVLSWGLLPSIVYLGATAARRGGWASIPLAVLVGIGMCASQTAAVLAARRRGTFVRTPKPGAGAPVSAPFGAMEAALAVYEAVGALAAGLAPGGQLGWFSVLLTASFGIVAWEGASQALRKGSHTIGQSQAGSTHAPVAASNEDNTR